ncbi:RmlC-like cupin [Ophiobolus disseminans]|uniref:RmlC-like cupin n=1 Tax=Ophiobolus disseminans TaxID=1469910 RepID=A0A6A6ZET4_9PLEO|nr:RmlC-like cupin [Ophiobolus disseminans]
MFAPIVFLTTLVSLVSAESRAKNPALNAALRTAASNYDRHDLLPKDSDWVHDFTKHTDFTSSVGAVLTADGASMPALQGLGMTVSLLKLAPCGMLPPHLHPRATNTVTAFTGNTTTWMIGENGVRTIVTQLTPMKMTIFPAGSLHVMQNVDCEPAILLSALNSDDAGTLNILPALWTVPEDIIRAGFGRKESFNPQEVGMAIPRVGTGAIIGSEECKKRCGIKPSEG